jgi:hypothetical protein
MLTLPKHLSSPMVFSEVRVAQFSVLCFVRSFFSSSFDHCINLETLVLQQRKVSRSEAVIRKRTDS